MFGGPDGNVWYTKQSGIGRATPSGMISEYGVLNGGDSAGIVNGPDGKLWFNEPSKNKIGSVTPAAQFKEFALPTPGSGPFAITLGPDGNLGFTEAAAAGNKIGRITPAGVVTQYPLATPLANAPGITKGPDGNLWFTELDGHQLGRITPEGVVSEFPIPSGASPGSIAPGKDGNLWYRGRQQQLDRSRHTRRQRRGVPDPHCRQRSVGHHRGTGRQPLVHGALRQQARPNQQPERRRQRQGLHGRRRWPADRRKSCSNDSDCLGSGKACGGDVCSSKVAPHVCVLATSGDPGTCSSDDKCWCSGEGATCDATSHACSIIVHDGAP